MDGVHLSIDARTLDKSVGKGRVKVVEPDGSLTYSEAKTLNSKLTERLEQIWSEYPNGLLDVTEEELARLPPDEAAVKEEAPVAAAEKEARDPSKMMSWDEMESLRSEIFLQLNDARNELWFVLELAKTLGVSSDFTSEPPLLPGQTHAARPKKAPNAIDKNKQSISIPGVPVEPPVLPPGTYSTTQTIPPSKPLWQEAYELELALAAKQKALDECSELVNAAIEELQSMADAGERFWSDIRALKEGKKGRGQWAIVPKPDFGRTLASGELARDVIVPYAVDEGALIIGTSLKAAPAALRVRSLAAFDLDPSKKDALAFGARTYQRLRVTMKDGSSTTCSRAAAKSDAEDVCEVMEEVQLEAFEAELFGEIRNEAASMDKAVIEPTSVKLAIGKQLLFFEMYDSREPQSTPSSTSDICDFTILCSRLLLSKLHRKRKSFLLNQLAPSSTASDGILKPIISTLRYSNVTTQMTSTLEMFRGSMEEIGVSANVESRFSAVEEYGREALRGLLSEEGNLEGLGAIFGLHIEGSITTIPSSAPTIQTSLASFQLSQMSSLAPLIADDLVRQLLPLCLRMIKEEIDEEHARHQVYIDALTDSITASGIGSLRISIPPPFKSVYASVSYYDNSPPDKFSVESGVTLRSWLRGLAIKIATIHA